MDYNGTSTVQPAVARYLLLVAGSAVSTGTGTGH
jgi:hypothetical protein